MHCSRCLATFPCCPIPTALQATADQGLALSIFLATHFPAMKQYLDIGTLISCFGTGQGSCKGCSCWSLQYKPSDGSEGQGGLDESVMIVKCSLHCYNSSCKLVRELAPAFWMCLV